MIAIAVLVVCSTRPVMAQSAAEAEALFREGKKLVKAGKLAEGCAKLEASERLESSTGTLLNLGDCREANGQLASAWAAFAKAATSAKRTSDPKREAEARRRATKLEPKLAQLAIRVAHRIDGLHVGRDDQSVDPEVWNADVPVDAGTYQIHASAPGHRPWTGTVVASNGAKSAIEIPELAVDETPVRAIPPPTVHADAPPPSTFTTTRKVAIGVGIAGVAGILVGAIYGSKARDLQHQADAICPQAACTDANAVSLDHDAQSDAKIANIGFVVGGAAAAGAIVMWRLGGPPTARDSVSLAPASHGTGLAITGSF